MRNSCCFFLLAISWPFVACASTLGTIHGPGNSLLAILSIAFMAWPIFLGMVIINLIAAFAIVHNVQKNQMAPALVPGLIKISFLIAALSFTFGPLAAIPALVCAYIARKKYPDAPGSGLIQASFVIGYLFLAQLAIGVLVFSINS